jgi:hypothetical protein
MKTSNFRTWCQNLWFDNRQENESYRLPSYTMKEYFEKYKYWLRREYRYQTQGVKNGT